MPKYLLEIPLPAPLSTEDKDAFAQRAASLTRKNWPRLQWVESIVTQDTLYAIFLAENDELIDAQVINGQLAGARVARVTAVIDPTFAEQEI